MVAQSPEPGAHVLNARAFRIELEFRNVGFCGEGKTGVPGEKPLGAEKRTNNKLNPHMTSSPGIEPGPHWWKASALTTSPSLLPHHQPCKRRLTMCSNMHFVRPLTKLCHVDSTLYLTFLLRNQDKLLLVQLYILFSFNTSVNIYYTEKIFLNTFRKVMLTVVTVLSHRKHLSDSNMN